MNKTFAFLIALAFVLATLATHALAAPPMPPGIVGDGTTDDTAAIQSALDAAGKTGGEVFLPPGLYHIAGSLSVPTGVALRGSWDAPHHGAWDKGTTLLVTGGRGEENGTPTITLNPSSALHGVTMLWPDQRADAITPYPWAIHGVGMHNTVEDVTFVDAYQGIKIGQPSSELHFIRTVYGCVLRRGIFIDSTTDIGRIEDVHFNTHYWMRSGYPAIQAGNPGRDVPAYTMKNLEAFIFGRSDWEYVLNTFVWGANVGYHFIKTPDGECNGQFSGIGADACNQDVLVDAMQPMGLQITNGEFTAFNQTTSAGLVVSPSASGAVDMVNCTFWSTPGGAAQLHGPAQTIFTGCHFQDRGTPGVIVADAGTVSVTACSFASGGKAVVLEPGTEAAVITGNLQPGGLNVTNSIGDAAQIGLNEGPHVFSAAVLSHYRLGIGSPAAGELTGDGWYGVETGDDAPADIRSPGVMARWTNGDAILDLPVTPGQAYTLQVWLTTRPNTPPETLTVAGGPTLPIPVGQTERLTAHIPASATAGRHRVTVTFQGKPWSPSVLFPGNGDTRELGVRVFQVEMQADGANGPAVNLPG